MEKKMESLWLDVKYGVRIMLKNPVFTLIAIIALALGIGANTAIFSVVYAVLLRPLPFKDPDRLVLVRQNLPKINAFLLSVSGAEFIEYKENNNAFSEVAAFSTSNMNITGWGEPARVRTARVSASLFTLLG